MDDAFDVRRSEPGGALTHDLEPVVQRDRALAEASAQVLGPVEVAHDQKSAALELSVVEQRDDVGIVNAGQRLGLAGELDIHLGSDVGPQRLEELERPLRLTVGQADGPIHLPDPAGADVAQDQPVADPTAEHLLRFASVEIGLGVGGGDEVAPGGRTARPGAWLADVAAGSADRTPAGCCSHPVLPAAASSEPGAPGGSAHASRGPAGSPAPGRHRDDTVGVTAPRTS